MKTSTSKKRLSTQIAAVGFALIVLLHIVNAHHADGADPAPIPINGKIAFDNGPGYQPNIFLMDPDGTDVKLLIESGIDPAWSPDGRRLAFVRSTGPNNTDLFVMNADGSNITQLTDTPDNEMQPDWSPDGARIAFVGPGANGLEILVMDAEGGNVTILTDSGNIARSPSWSPDSSKIAYAGTINTDPYDIFVMDDDGSNKTQLTTNIADEYQPSWSPDGNRIAYSRVISGGGENQLFIMNADGSNQKNLTNDTGVGDNNPSWSPDGKQIVFLRHTSLTWPSIFRINADGTGLTRISNFIFDLSADWQPIIPSDFSHLPMVTR